MTMGWNQIVNFQKQYCSIIGLVIPDDLLDTFKIRVLEYNLGVRNSNRIPDYVLGLQDRTFWRRGNIESEFYISIPYFYDNFEFKNNLKNLLNSLEIEPKIQPPTNLNKNIYFKLTASMYPDSIKSKINKFEVIKIDENNDSCLIVNLFGESIVVDENLTSTILPYS